MPQKRSFGFVADSPDHFDREAETTLFLIREIERLGHSVFLCEPKDLFLKQNEVWAKGINLKSLDCLFLRKDPPFDLAYLHHLYLLVKLEGEVLMINEPSAILEFNEKLSTLDFPFSPKTLVSANMRQICDWARSQKNGVVLKPLHLSGGTNIHWIKRSAVSNQRSAKILKQMTANGLEPIICQEYLMAAKKGDKRILVWDGKILGGFLRKPKPGEFRANLHQGGRFVACELTARDKKIAHKVGKWAKAKGLYFVGLDVIGEHLTEINVTSPMGIREVNVLYGECVEKEIIHSILKRI